MLLSSHPRKLSSSPFACTYLSRIRVAVARGSARHDRNMLVKHNLLDSFGVSGLVLVLFGGGTVEGVSKLLCR